MTCSAEFAVGLDVGTTKICAICGRQDMEAIKIMSVRSTPSYGLRKGIVVDMDAAAESVRRALRSVEEEIGTKIRSVFVGIAGGHIKGFTGYGAVGVKGGRVREEDVGMLLDSAGAVCVPVDREILHVIPSGFTIDGSNGINNPVGMRADRLEGKVHIVTGSVASVRNLVKCCEMAEVEVDDIVLEPLASSDAVLEEEERERGVALIDIGGGTTDIAVYSDGVLKHTAVLALGGNHITNDIAVGLGISVGEAERIKKTYGYSMTGIIEEDVDICVEKEGEETRIPRKFVTEIIEPRCEELFLLVKKELDIVAGEPGLSSRVSGIVLTGGTALLNGIDIMTKLILRLPVRLGTPLGIADDGLANSPQYATGVGLLRYGLVDRERHYGATPEGLLTAGGILERMRYWVKGHFG